MGRIVAETGEPGPAHAGPGIVTEVLPLRPCALPFGDFRPEFLFDLRQVGFELIFESQSEAAHD